MDKINPDLYEEISLAELFNENVLNKLVVRANQYYLVVEINEGMQHIDVEGIEFNITYKLKRVEIEEAKVEEEKDAKMVIEDDKPTNRFDLMDF